MPFNLRVPTTEYMSAVNRAPVSLSEPNDRRLPMTGSSEQPLGEIVVERDPGPVDEETQPLAMVHERA